MSDSTLLGGLDRADRQVIAGWAADRDAPGQKVTLSLLIDGVAVGELKADRYRADLAQNGLGDGRHGFEIRMPAGLSAATARQVRMLRARDGAELPMSPRVLPAEAMTPEAALLAVAEALQAAAADSDAAALPALVARLAARVAELEAGADEKQAAFLERWGVEAPAEAPPPEAPAFVGRALLIDESIPDPERDAGSRAILSHMMAVQALGLSVDFVPSWSPRAEPEDIARLAALDMRVWHAPWIGSVEEVLRAAGPLLDVVYVHRHAVMAKYAALVRSWCPGARLVYCLADLHHLREARAEAMRAGITVDMALSDHVAELRDAEFAAVRAADATITHSGHEAELLAAAVPEAELHLIPWSVPAGLPPDAAERPAGVGFIGSYGHQPNLDAAYWLLNKVMPLVWAEEPELPCVLAGSGMPDALRAAAAAASGPVTALGEAAKLDLLWERVRVSIAPLRFGAGLKGKVLDSLAAGVPCVCSLVAAEGLALPAALQGLVGETAEALAAGVLALHRDPALHAAASLVGQAFIAEEYNEARVRRLMAGAIGRPELVEGTS